MNALFCLFAFSTLLIPEVASNCKLLPDGIYQMVQDFPSHKASARMKVENGRFLQIEPNGDATNYNLVWVYGCTFRVESPTGQKEQLTGLNAVLRKSFGQPCYELLRKNGDTTFFRTTYTGNLHITTSSGVFIILK